MSAAVNIFRRRSGGVYGNLLTGDSRHRLLSPPYRTLISLRRRSDGSKQGYKGVAGRRPADSKPSTPFPPGSEPLKPAANSSLQSEQIKASPPPLSPPPPPPPGAGNTPPSKPSFQTLGLRVAALSLAAGLGGYYWWYSEEARWGPGPVIPKDVTGDSTGGNDTDSSQPGEGNGGKLLEAAESTGDEIAKSSDEVAEGVKEGLKEGEEVAENVAEGVKEKAEEVEEKVKETAEESADSVKKIVASAGANSDTESAIEANGVGGKEWGQPEDEFVLEKSVGTAPVTGDGKTAGAGSAERESQPEQLADGQVTAGYAESEPDRPDLGKSVSEEDASHAGASGFSTIAGLGADLAHNAVEALAGGTEEDQEAAKKAARDADDAADEAAEKVHQTAKMFTPEFLISAGHEEAARKVHPKYGDAEFSDQAEAAAGAGGEDFSLRGVIDGAQHGYETEGEREVALAREGGGTGGGSTGVGGSGEKGSGEGGSEDPKVIKDVAALLYETQHEATERQAQVDSKIFHEEFERLKEDHRAEIKDAQAAALRHAQMVNRLEAELERTRSQHQAALQDQHRRAEERRARDHKAQEVEHEATLEEAKLVAEAATAAALAAEEGRFLSTLDQIHLQVKALQEAFFTKSEESRKSHGAHKLAMCAFALEDALVQGAPLDHQLATLQAAAGGPGADPLVDAALRSLPPAAAHQGAATRAQLQARLASLVPAVRELALIPPEGGGVIAHGLAKAVALLKVSERGSSLEGGGAEAVLARAESLLAAGKLAEAAQAIQDGLRGTKAEILVRDWAMEARNRAIAEQAVALVQAHATAVAAGLS